MKILNIFWGFVLFLTYTVQAFEGPKTPLIEQVIYHENEVLLLIDNAWLRTEGFQVSSAGAFALIYGEWMPLVDAVEFGDFQVSWHVADVSDIIWMV